MDQALTNKKFIEQIDDVIETLGGTPVDLELTEDREDDMVSNGVFVDKMDEVIQALGGTPSEIIVGDDKADDMVSDNIFQLKMEDVVKNMSGGGGGGSAPLIVHITEEGSTWTLDKTWNEIKSAMESGMVYILSPYSTTDYYALWMVVEISGGHGQWNVTCFKDWYGQQFSTGVGADDYPMASFD